MSDLARRLITGHLADEVRKRFNATGDVYFTETSRDTGGCESCAETEHVLTIECGKHRHEIATTGLPSAALLGWLEAPAREAARKAAEEAEKARQAVNDEAFTRGIIEAFAGAVDAVESEGYADAGEWHDQLMRRLGVKGYQK